MRNQRIKKSKFRAFSLIELLITISVLVIIGLTGGMHLYTHYVRQGLDLSVREIASVLREAQHKAIIGKDGDGDGVSDKWGVYFKNGAIDFYQTFFGSAYSAANVIKTNTLRTGLQFNEPAEGASKQVLFSKISGLPISSSTIIIALNRDASVSSTIIINENGNIQY